VTLFIIFHSLICVFLVCVILLQPGKGDAGIGFGSSSQSIFGSRGAGNFLTKMTSACALIFLVTSFVLTRVRLQETSRSVIKPPAPFTGTGTAPSPQDEAAAAAEKLGEAVRSAKESKGAPPASPAKGSAPEQKK